MQWGLWLCMCSAPGPWDLEVPKCPGEVQCPPSHYGQGDDKDLVTQPSMHMYHIAILARYQQVHRHLGASSNSLGESGAPIELSTTPNLRLT